MAIRAVLWDIDDTIFDHTAAAATGMARHLAAEGLPPGHATADAAVEAWQRVSQRHWARFSAGETDWQGQRRDRAREFLGRAMGDDEADAWFDRHVSHYESAWALFPDAVPALDALAGTYRHAVLSNSALESQHQKLTVLGVRDRFESLICAAELGISKPAAGAFLASCDALGLDAHEVLYVGDEPDIDAAGATAAGLTGVWLDRRGLGGRPELTRITGLGQLPGLLAGNTRFGASDTFG
ncbi:MULTISPECIES: HAD family hydrolase [unclassified Streptomyces]|uniref:HAD family hydrolase n=1 Tax=unclassified Streptomyces TaxID=2593676 RepID=UPI002ED2B093|nr:HAD family hydrolase [Streptomyces sp. NBC_00891]WSY08015.1 HAD family hydrolase [Streptomyces sp. NBC_00890]WSZ09640.1 HAD family hydrolase [Streptomyces sp. NBC_00869]WSZ22859.1 HAD family hydrolase [Streptomyces sp. NBC_00870]